MRGAAKIGAEGAKGAALPEGVEGSVKVQGQEVDPITGQPKADSEPVTVAKPVARPNNCFVASTPVMMADGTLKAIEQVHKGDLVASKDPVTGKQGAKRVLRTFVNTAQVLLALTFGNGEKITTTPGHPFATSDKGDFVLADNLPLNTALPQWRGQTTLSAAQALSGPQAIYNFEVEDWHTYFVGQSNTKLTN